MQLEELKLFLKIDGNDDDILIQSLQIAAEEYLTDAGITQDYTKERYKLAIKILTAHWYENRDVIMDKRKSEVPFGLSNLIVQLKDR